MLWCRYARASVVFGFAILGVNLSEKIPCGFTGRICDKCKIYDDDSIGCGFYDLERNQCLWLDDLPQGMPQRMFYNDLMIEARKELGECQ